MTKKSAAGRLKFGIKTLLVVCGLLLTLSVSAQAQEVDILWQGNTYTPPFYKGRSLWTNQTSLTISAIPHIPAVSNRAGLNYKWARNNTVLGAASGIGNNSLFLTDSLGNTQDIRLEILSTSGSLLETKYFNMAPTAPDLMIYENNPLYGLLFHREVGQEYAMQEEEKTFAAFPLFFAGQNRFSNVLEYSWRTNQGATTDENSSTYRAPEGVVGSSEVTVQAKNKDRITQSVRKSFVIQFGR